MAKGIFILPRLTAKRYALFLPMALLAPSADAYIGPGAGLTAIGSLLALIAAVLLAIVGFLWFPMKRLLRKIRGRTRNNGAESNRQ